MKWSSHCLSKFSFGNLRANWSSSELCSSCAVCLRGKLGSCCQRILGDLLRSSCCVEVLKVSLELVFSWIYAHCSGNALSLLFNLDCLRWTMTWARGAQVHRCEVLNPQHWDLLGIKRASAVTEASAAPRWASSRAEQSGGELDTSSEFTLKTFAMLGLFIRRSELSAY